MRGAFGITMTTLAGLAVAWHFDGTLEHLGYRRRWGRFSSPPPSWIDGPLGAKWVLAAATMVLGMVLADNLVRRHIQGLRQVRRRRPASGRSRPRACP